MTPEPVTISLPDGVQLRGSCWPVSDRWTLLLHEPGEGHDSDELMPLVGAVLRSGSSVAAVDLPGHGFSDGTWDRSSDHGAVLGHLLDWVEPRTPARIGLVAVGAACYPALVLAEHRAIDVLVLVSPIPSPDQVTSPASYRGGGAAKLLVCGGADAGFRDTASALRQRSIGWGVSLMIGSTEQGAVLLSGPHGARVREGVEQFLREQWALGRRRDVPATHGIEEIAR